MFLFRHWYCGSYVGKRKKAGDDELKDMDVEMNTETHIAEKFSRTGEEGMCYYVELKVDFLDFINRSNVKYGNSDSY